MAKTDPYGLENITWDCLNCGTQQVSGDICPNCGAFKGDPKTGRHFQTAPPAPTTLATIGYEPPINSASYFPTRRPFVFNRAHEPFVNGERRVLARNWGTYLLLILAIVGAGVFTVIAVSNYLELLALRGRGLTITATVSDKTSTRSSGRNSSTTYFLSVLYRVDEQTYTLRQGVRFDIWNRRRIQDRVQVRYLPERPETARLTGADTDDGGIEGALYASIAASVLVAIFAVLYLNHMLRNRKLSLQGQTIDGQIIGSELNRSKSTYTLKLRYEFTSPQSGKVINRKESTVRNDLKRDGKPAPGIPVKILYVNDRTYRVL